MFKRVCLFLLPIFLFVGVIRLGTTNNYENFQMLPSYESFYRSFSTLPDLIPSWDAFVDSYQGTWANTVCFPDFTDVYNPTMECGVPSWLQSFDMVLSYIGNILLAPVKLLSWFISWLTGYYA